MDPFSIHQLTTARHDDLVREANESRLARLARESHEDSCPAPPPVPRPRPARARRLGIAR